MNGIASIYSATAPKVLMHGFIYEPSCMVILAVFLGSTKKNIKINGLHNHSIINILLSLYQNAIKAQLSIKIAHR